MAKRRGDGDILRGGFSVEMSQDLARVRALPRRPPVAAGTPEAERVIAAATERFGRPRADACRCQALAPTRFWDRTNNRPKDGCIRRLNYVQAWALWEIAAVSGLLAPVAVGGGKTVIDLLAPLAMPGCRTALLLAPSSLAKQVCLEYELLREHFYVPLMFLHGTAPRSYDEAEARAKGIPCGGGQPVLHVMPYSKLSRPDATAWISGLGPDTIIADECDKLSDPDTATTGRVRRYFRERESTRFVALTGSLTDDSLQDYAHLAAYALRWGSPVPIDPEVVDEWCAAIDPSDWPAEAGALRELRAADQPRDTPLYDIFHRRFVETPGVVATSESSSTAELRVVEEPAPPIPADIDADLAKLREHWLRPDGELLLDALAVARAARELACGFFYYWHFPRGEKQTVIDEWKAARKAFRAEQRDILAERIEHMDSEHLTEQAAMRAWGDLPPVAGLPVWRAQSWPRWRAAKGTVVYETRTERRSDYLARHTAAWAHANRGVVWYETRAFGEWVAEISGLPMFPGGAKAAEAMAREDGSRSIIASVSAHGRGRDGLQRIYCDQLVGEPPSSATRWEQLLGRLDRQGQTSPVVWARFYRHTKELRAHVDQAVRRALYVQGTIGAHQKLTAGFLK